MKSNVFNKYVICKYAMYIYYCFYITFVLDLRVLHMNQEEKSMFIEIFIGKSKFMEIVWILKMN